MAKMKAIAVVGNPNSGKTTLFNGLTGSNQRIGNWPGVTVEKKEGVIDIEGTKTILVDLPGIYSLTAQSEDERVARDYILSGEPDLVVNIVDATNLERNLYLSTQLLEMGVPVLMVVNMMDLAESKGIRIDLDGLAKQLGCPVIGISSTHKKSLAQVKQAIYQAVQKPHPVNTIVNYPAEVEAVLQAWTPKIQEIASKLGVQARWVAIKLLELDPWVTENVTNAGVLTSGEIQVGHDRIVEKLGDTTDLIVADARYRRIQELADALIRRGACRESAGDRLDRIVMHRWLGIPIFLGIMYLLFWTTINVGGAFIDFFDILFGTVFVDGFGELLAKVGTPEWLISILAGGIGAGIQTLATFIPVIFMMFLMLSLLEDSGYMARAALF